MIERMAGGRALKILFLNPVRFAQRLSLGNGLITCYISSPSATFAQLAACAGGSAFSVIDGQVGSPGCADFIGKFKGVDLVAISIHSSMEAADCEINIRAIKKYYPDIRIVIGGYHATYFYERWLGIGADYVIRHEADISFGELVRRLGSGESLYGLHDLVFKDKEKVIVNPSGEFIRDLDLLAFPRFDIMEYADYSCFFSPGLPAGGVELSRGCPFNCKFCLTSGFWGHKYRRKSNSRIIREIESLLSLGVKSLWFYTSSFGLRRDEDEQLCRKIIELNIGISWRTSLRADIALSNPGLMELASKAGLRVALVGYETLDPQLNSEFKSGGDFYTPENLRRTYRLLKDNGIAVEGSFIAGLPGAEKGGRLQAKELAGVCDHLLIQAYRPDVSKMNDPVNSDEYRRLFYFDASKDPLSSESYRRKLKLEFLYYFNPLSVWRRLSAKDALVRGIYKRIYAKILENLMGFLPFSKARRRGREYSALLKDIL